MEDSQNDLKVSLEKTEDFFNQIEVEEIKTEFVGRIITLVVASFTLITALAWEDIFKRLFYTFFGPDASLGSEIFYAFILTLVAVIISVVLGRRYIKRKSRVEIKKHKKGIK
jgi:hypothetical protein